MPRRRALSRADQLPIRLPLALPACRLLHERYNPAARAAQPKRRPLAAEVSSRRMSPTVFREGPFRFFFFSLEEARMHIHVHSADGEAKFWIEPSVELSESHGLRKTDIARIEELIRDHENDIRDAWNRHFGR